MKKQKEGKRYFVIFIVILTIVMLIFLASYFNLFSKIKANCQAPAPHFNDLISIFEIPLADLTLPAEYNSQSCVDWLKDDSKKIEANDCYIKKVEIGNDSNPIITCHCWHRE